MSETRNNVKERPSASLAKLYGSSDTKIDDTKTPGVPLLPPWPKGERSDKDEKEK
jgi:hypothetical protein